MDTQEYRRTLEEFFQGEVTGEALFHCLAESLDDREHQYQMRVMEQLERETKELLRGNVARLGGDTKESAAARDRGVAQVKAIAAMPWAKFLHIFQREVRKFVARFEEVERMGPPEDAKLLAAVTAHERALLAYSERESSGQGDPLQPIRALLKTVPSRKP
jgi:dimethylamine/trimethylamine dehydrogenase